MFESFYGLSAAPFQLSPDPEFFYGSRGHKRAYAYLQYGLYQGEGFITLTGEVGAGKTTLIRSLLRDLDSRKVVAAQLVSTQLDADSLLRAVATGFGLVATDAPKARVLALLEGYLVSLAAEGQRALLVVDEAQNLAPESVEELRMLSNFQLENRALLQSFLIGQPELRQLMRSPGMQQLRQRVIASYHLGPLDEDETRAYVEHRLRHVEWNGDPRFSEKVFGLLHRHTGGIPRRINTLCTRALLAAYLANKHEIDESLLEEIVAELAGEFGESTSAYAAPAEVRVGREAANVRPIEALESRVASVEHGLAMTVSLVRQLTRARAAEAPLNKKSA